jgi:3-phenylpropionate/cinnamic acid dioxygenase small subunit
MSTARDEITELLFCYAERIDAGDFEGLADLFTHAEMTFAGYDQVCSGRQEVLARYTSSTRRYEDDGTPKTKHVMTNVIVAVDELNDTATSRSYFTVLQAVAGTLGLQVIIAGRYEDRFELAESSWRFTSRHVMVDLVGDLSAHLLFDLGR